MNPVFIGKGIALVFVGLVGLIGVVRGAARRASVRAQLRAAPTEFADNTAVAFTGIVKLVGEPLVAPLSGKPCVGYRAVARIYRPTRGRSGVRRVDSEVVELNIPSFMLVTKEGDVHVAAATCVLLLRPSPIIPRKLELEQRFLARANTTARASDTGFDETRIEVGMKLVVHGIARTESDPAAHGGETGFREAPTRVCVSGDEKHPLTIDAV